MNLEARAYEAAYEAMLKALTEPGSAAAYETGALALVAARAVVAGLGLTVEHGKQEGQIVERCAWGNLTRYVSRWERRDVVV